MTRPRPALLIILDGFGISLEKEANPVNFAKIPVLQGIEKMYPFTTLQASGVAVGLPWGEAGNSEVGHLTIGSGRAIYHHLPRIINSISDRTFFTNPVLLKVAQHIRKNNSRVHIAGLISSGSVHSYIDHIYAFLEFIKKEKLPEAYIHIFSDGKDAPPKEGAKFIQQLRERLDKDYPMVKFASVIGRFYGMDRDEKWDRVQKTYELLTEGKGEKISSIPEYLESSYDKNITDEHIEPAVLADDNGRIMGRIEKGDALIFSDFREDSMREITHAFADRDFEKFPRKKVENLMVATLTEYQKSLADLAIFPQLEVISPLSGVLDQAGLSHLHIAETQKYAHVTYFFNGGREESFPREKRVLVSSPPVSHFDEAPSMSAREIEKKILENFDNFDVIIANFANADMVGHSGNFSAAVKAVEVLDEVVGRLLEATLTRDAAALITADHGNVEVKRQILTGEKRTEHSVNPVPLYLLGKNYKRSVLRTEKEVKELKKQAGGIITDVAPTLLEILGIDQPAEMTGKSLLPMLLEQTK